MSASQSRKQNGLSGSSRGVIDDFEHLSSERGYTLHVIAVYHGTHLGFGRRYHMCSMILLEVFTSTSL